MKTNLLHIALAMSAMSCAASAQEAPVTGFVSIGAVQTTTNMWDDE